MKPLAAEGLMYDPGLIECADFDWFFCPMSGGRSVLCLAYRATATPLAALPVFAVRAKRFLSGDNGKAPILKRCLCSVVVGAISLVGCHSRLRRAAVAKLDCVLKPFMQLSLEGGEATPAHVQLFIAGSGRYL